MGFLTNRTVNFLNLHIAVVALLDQAWLVFMPLYLYEQGFPLAFVFAMPALCNVMRLFLRPLSIPLVHRFGLKKILMLGATGFALSFPLLAQVKGFDVWLLLYASWFGLFNALHWHCLHTWYSLAGEGEKRGRQLAVANALAIALSALAPLLGALLIVDSGFRFYFWMPVIATFPMLWLLHRCEDIPVPRISWREGKKLAFNLGVKIHIAEASATFPILYGWLFTVYFYVEHITTLGGIVTFGIAAQVLYQLWLGTVVDRGGGSVVSHAAGGLRVMQVLGKSLAPLSMPAILGLETVAAAGNIHHLSTQPITMYNDSKSSSYPLWYWFFAESAYDLGTLLGAGSAALLILAGASPQQAILIALPGVGVVWFLTWRYFRRLHAVP